MAAPKLHITAVLIGRTDIFMPPKIMVR